MATHRGSRKARRSATSGGRYCPDDRTAVQGSRLSVRKQGPSDTSFYRWHSRLATSVERAEAMDNPSSWGFIDAGHLRSEDAQPARLELTLN